MYNCVNSNSELCLPTSVRSQTRQILTNVIQFDQALEQHVISNIREYKSIASISRPILAKVLFRQLRKDLVPVLAQR